MAYVSDGAKGRQAAWRTCSSIPGQSAVHSARLVRNSLTVATALVAANVPTSVTGLHEVIGQTGSSLTEPRTSGVAVGVGLGPGVMVGVLVRVGTAVRVDVELAVGVAAIAP